MNKELLPQTPEGAVFENALLTTYDLDMNELKRKAAVLAAAFFTLCEC